MNFNKGISTSLIIIIISVVVLVGGGVTYYYAAKTQQNNQQQNTPNQNNSNSQGENLSANAESLFGTMIAFNINDAATGISGTLQKGWTEFRKDNSAYQKLLDNLEKLIQDRTKLVKATGFSLDREIVGYFTWNMIEPQKGQFDWELTDLYAQTASNAGIKISAVIQPFASWDQKNTLPLANCNALDFAYYDFKAGAPNDLSEYQNFLTKTVERYKDKVVVWEIGNEVEGNCGGYKNNPQGYVALLKTSYETIKKADPQAKVVNGGALEINNDSEIRSFWQQFFALDGGQYIDYFNLHYNTERSPDANLNLAAFQEALAFFNNLMDKNGGKKPLYLTEFGIYSGSPSSQPISQPVQGLGLGQTNLPAQPMSSGQSSNPPSGGKCGDGICDDFEKQNSNACPQDCGTSSQQPTQQSQSGKSIPNQSEDSQAALYFKDSIIAFADGVNVIFIDLVGSNNDIIGSSMAFNPEGQSRLFLTTLKTIASKINGFSEVEKITDGQYKFNLGTKTIYALWLGTLSNKISGQVKVTDIKGQERLIDAAGIKLSADQPVFIEL